MLFYSPHSSLSRQTNKTLCLYDPVVIYWLFQVDLVSFFCDCFDWHPPRGGLPTPLSTPRLGIWIVKGTANINLAEILQNFIQIISLYIYISPTEKKVEPKWLHPWSCFMAHMSEITRTQKLGVSRWHSTSCATLCPESCLGGVPYYA